MARKRKPKWMNFVNEHIWNVRLEDRNKFGSFLVKQVRIILIVSRNFTRDKLQFQAAGLTYYTLLSVVPVVALIFAIAKGFGFQEKLEQELLRSMKGHEEVVEQIMVFATKMLDNTQGGWLAGVGVIVLLWSVLQLLSNIENSFNDIWQVVKGRTWARKFTEYFSIMLVAPVVMVVSSSITVIITTEMEDITAGEGFLRSIGPYVYFLIKMIPYALVWLLFTFVYMLMPNTKVRFISALIAGIIAGTSFQLVQWAYINFQVGVSNYNAIYGSFAALPLFLIWINISWLITLIGAEIAFANQFVSEIENEVDSKKLSTKQRHTIALLICKMISDRFEQDIPPITAKELSKRLKLPFGVTSKILEFLVEANVLIEVEWEQDQPNGFLPAHTMDKVRISDILDALDSLKYTPIPGLERGVLSSYIEDYDKLRKQMSDSEANLLVKDLPALKN